MIDLTRKDDVFVLRVDAGENRFDETVVGDWNTALDEVERSEGPKALVTTGTGKFYSNGLDLDYMLRADVDGNAYLKSVLAVLSRILTFPTATACAINGHAFGAGALMALVHDSRVMRTDRGYFCMPEVDLKAPLHPGMTAILLARLAPQTAHEVITTATRYTADRALERQIVDAVATEDQVVAAAIERVAPLAAKADPVIGRIKRDLYPQVVEALAGEMVA